MPFLNGFRLHRVAIAALCAAVVIVGLLLSWVALGRPGPALCDRTVWQRGMGSPLAASGAYSNADDAVSALAGSHLCGEVSVSRDPRCVRATSSRAGSMSRREGEWLHYLQSHTSARTRSRHSCIELASGRPNATATRRTNCT